jgi:uncharacterized membrane protein YkvA (DUF1232 family)
MAKSNVFFRLALKRAEWLLKKKTRIIVLLKKLSEKISTTNFKEVKAKDKFLVLGRMIKAYAMGQYREIPWKTLLLITAGVVYFVNPIDLIPDWIPIAGLTDDFGILMWIYSSLRKDIDLFVAWEEAQKSKA